MKAHLKSRRFWLEHIAWVSALVLSLVLVGCGETQSDDQGIIVKNPQRSRPVTTPATVPPPVVDSTEAVSGSEVQVAEEPHLIKQVSFEDAETAFNEKRYNEAVELFVRYTERKTENPWGFYMLGLSARMTSDYETAQSAFERSLELDPRHVKSYLNLARVLIDTGESESALIPLRMAIEIDPESATAYRLKGSVFDDIHQRPQAVENYQRAIALDPDDAWSMNNLALVFIREGLFEKAVPPLARAVEIDGDNVIFLNNLGMALEHQGQFRAAEQAYGDAVTTDDSYEKAVLNLARVQEVREDPGLIPIDLTSLAIAFVDEITEWREASAEVDPGSKVAEPEITVTEHEPVKKPAEDSENDPESSEEVKQN